MAHPNAHLSLGILGCMEVQLVHKHCDSEQKQYNISSALYFWFGLQR